jgi:hypothetical protein
VRQVQSHFFQQLDRAHARESGARSECGARTLSGEQAGDFHSVLVVGSKL